VEDREEKARTWVEVATYSIELAPTAYAALEEVADKKDLREIAKIIDGLKAIPEGQGKALVGPLEGLRSLAVSRTRYRIIYQIDKADRRVSILLVGPRKPGRNDVYALAQKLMDLLRKKKR
jgi:mRNA-degrading endonuclease RelE of RelBE toxin-antitoxin system